MSKLPLFLIGLQEQQWNKWVLISLHIQEEIWL